MARIIESGEAYYEAREVPFGKVYEWHSAYITVKCECGEESTLDATGATTICRCGTDLGEFTRLLQETQNLQPDRVAHPWFYDAQVRAQQSRRDEATYPKGSPWRYDDITDEE